MAHIHEDIPSMLVVNPETDVPPLVEAVVRKALAKRADDRYSSMDELVEALKAAAAGIGPGPSAARRAGDDFSGTFTPVDMPLPSIDIVAPEPLGSPFVDPRAEQRKKWVIGGVAILAATIGAFAAWDTDDPPAPVAPAPGVTAPVAPTPEPVTPAPQRVVVTLRSTPAGARVVVGDHTYGPTPTEVEWLGDDAAEGREIAFQFQLDGYRDFTVTRTILDDALEVSAEMERIQVAPRRTTPRRTSSAASGSEDGPGRSVGIKGYKAEPY
jgi:serine/threonine-protein kinase